MRVAVTGGTGFLGAHIVERLIDRGHEPVCLVRPKSDRSHLDALGVTQVPGSLGEKAGLARLVADADAVIHAAGAIAAGGKSGYHEANTTGTKNLLAACTTNPPDHLAYVSSLAAKGPSPTPEPLPADGPAHPVSSYGKSKLGAEQAVRDYAGETATTSTIVRPPALYGPRDRGLLGLMKTAKRGFYPLLVPADSRVSLLYGPDCARLIVHALADRPREGGVTILEPADGPPHTPETIRESVTRALDSKRLRSLPVPYLLLAGAAGVAVLTARLTGTANILNPDKVRELRTKHWVSDTGTTARIDWGRRTPLDDGLRTTRLWYEREGWL